MFPLPLQTDNDLISADDAAEGTLDYGAARGRRFKGIIDFGRLSDFTTDAAQAEAGWQSEFQSQMSRGASPENAAVIASINWPYAPSAKNNAAAVAVARDVAAGLAQKAAQDAQLKAQAANAAAQGVKIGTDVATQQIAAQQARDKEQLAKQQVVGYDKNGAPVVIDKNGQPVLKPESSNTAMYLGAGAVLLGLAFVAMKKKRGSLGGYSRRSRKSRRRSRR